MHAPVPDQLTCLSCGYDLRAARAGAGAGAGASAKCPECGFLVSDSVAAHARDAGRWGWRVRLGLVLMLLATPPLIVSMLTLTYFRVPGVPLTPLNFAGPKVWGMPMTRMFVGGEEDLNSAIVLLGLIVNTTGIYLLTTPPAARVERTLALRRWLRLHAVAVVAGIWPLVTPWWGGWPALPGNREYDAPAFMLLIEIPGTLLLYLYLAQLARERLRDPRMARRATNLLKGIVPLQIIGVVAVSGAVRLPESVDFALLVAYGTAAVCVGFWSIDLCLDLYRALGDIERDPPAG